MLQEERLDQYEALEEVRFRTVDATPEQAFLAGGDVRIGEFILLVDSDTRVPEHCILPTVTELLLSPEVAFTQHFTTPLQVGGACCHPCMMPCTVLTSLKLACQARLCKLGLAGLAWQPV